MNASYIVPFVIDEEYSYSLFDDVDNKESEINTFIENTESCAMTNCSILYSDRFYSNSFGGKEVTEIFFSPTAIGGENRDLFSRFQILIDRSEQFSCDDLSVESANIQFDFSRYIFDNGLLGLITEFDYSVEFWWNTELTKKVCNTYSATDFYRFFISINSITQEEFWKAASEIYPKLFFNEDKNRLRFTNLEVNDDGQYLWILKTLGFLNDFAIEKYYEDSNAFEAFAGSNGLSISKESHRIKSSKRLMKFRDVQIIDNEMVCCEWHAKYRYDKGRIHFNMDQGLSSEMKKVAKGKLIVGLFCGHLPI